MSKYLRRIASKKREEQFAELVKIANKRCKANYETWHKYDFKKSNNIFKGFTECQWLCLQSYI